MASKKQRRRRDKERRHEYEYVYVDEEGREVEVDEADSESRNGAKSARTTTKTASPGAVKTGSGRVIEPPSWRRVLRRVAIFAPLMAIVLYILPGENKTPGTILATTVVLMAFFVPFSYLMDSLLYRMAVKRGAKTGGAGRGGPPK